jgi:FRG domain
VDKVKAVSLAGDFFADNQINGVMGINSAATLWAWIENGASTPVSGSSAPVPRGDNVVYRGQATATHGLSSSLYRLCREIKGATVVEADLADAEATIIEAMRAEGLGRLMTDGELIMVLQHHHMPTRLIDVSAAATEALFFAVDHNDAADGRLFIIDIHDPTSIPLDESQQLPWTNAVWGSLRSTGDWSGTVALVNAESLDPRMRAQQGKFLVGGLNRRLSGRFMWIGNRQVPATDYPDVTSLGINFVRQRRSMARRNANWPATGWTIKIEAAWKPELRDWLAHLPDSIQADTMYPPVTEVKRLALSVARRSLE